MHEQKLLNQILDRENLKETRKKVVRNKGAAGVDGMETEELLRCGGVRGRLTD